MMNEISMYAADNFFLKDISIVEFDLVTRNKTDHNSVLNVKRTFDVLHISIHLL